MGREVKGLSVTLIKAHGDTDIDCLVSVLQIIPSTDADGVVGTLVSAVEGTPVEEAETEKAALPTGEGASLGEAKIDTATTEVIDSNTSHPEETETAAIQVSVLVKWSFEGDGTNWNALLVNYDNSFE